MILIKFDKWGRMGNRMFQYAFGHILSKQKDVEIFSTGIKNFNIKDNSKKYKPSNSFIYTRGFGDNYVDYDLLLKTTNDIVVDSYVQKSKYYKDYKQLLQNVFNITTKTINKNKLVLHVRETDYTQLNCFLGYETYKQIIKESGFSDVIIVTDNSKCETVQKLLSDGCVLNSEGIVSAFSTDNDDRAMIDFYTLLNSENIALSQSSFSWWAAFLGNHKKVYYPFRLDDKGMWKCNPGRDDVDLFYESDYNIQIIL